MKKLDCQRPDCRSSDIERNSHVGQVSTIMRALTSKDAELLSHFEKTDESETEIENTSLHHHLINNHDVASNKGKIKGKLPLEHIFGFCRTFGKLSKQIEFHLTFKTSDLGDIIYTTLGDDFKGNFDKLFLYVPLFIPDAQTQIKFMDCIKNSFILSIDP